jgi:hypothetical protein
VTQEILAYSPIEEAFRPLAAKARALAGAESATVVLVNARQHAPGSLTVVNRFGIRVAVAGGSARRRSGHRRLPVPSVVGRPPGRERFPTSAPDGTIGPRECTAGRDVEKTPGGSAPVDVQRATDDAQADPI